MWSYKVKQQHDAIVYIVDDDPSVRDALSSLVESAGLEAKTCKDVSEFLDSYDAEREGCLVLDIRMPDINGLDFLESFPEHDVNIPTIVISGHGDIRSTVRAMKAGAFDFIEKPFRRKALMDKIMSCIEKDSKRRIIDFANKEFENKLKLLTSREREVLDLLVCGYSYKKIALKLGISHRTVEVHRNRCILKLQQETTIELVKSVTSYNSYREQLIQNKWL